MTQPRRSLKSRRPAPRRRRTPVLEVLEDRTLLSSNPANVFAQLTGVVPAGGSRQISIAVQSPADFTLAAGKVLVGFVVKAAGSTLDPQVVQVSQGGNAVAPLYSIADLPGRSDSLSLVSLGAGSYTLTLTGKGATAGAFQVDAFLAGDADGSRSVTTADGSILKAMAAKKVAYNAAADANLDGVIDAFDIAQWSRNSGTSTRISPLSITAALGPRSVPLGDGTLLTNVAGSTLSGTVSTSSASVALGQNGVFGTPVAVSAGGAYSFPVSLAEGGTTYQVRASDGFGQQATATLAVSLDSVAPAVTLSGGVQPASVNHNVTVSGSVGDVGSGVTSLTAALDAGPAVAVAVNPATGAFTTTTGLALDHSADGPHTLHLTVTDRAGNTTTRDVSFTLDTVPPAVTSFGLSSASLAPAGSGQETDAARVTLTGRTEPGATVTLAPMGATTVASTAGIFQFANVPLALGDNAFTVQAQDAAGNVGGTAQTVRRTVATGRPNGVLVWNQAVLDAIQTDGSDPLFASRNLALVQAAVYDALNAIEGTPAYYVRVAAPAGALPEAAVDVAAHDVLAYVYPAQKETFDALLAARLALLPEGAAKSDGQAVGAAAAAAIIALRTDDGSRAYVNYVPGTGPGAWQPTAPAYAPALLPLWGQVTPFALASPDQFVPAGPPALSSAQWADAVNQVKSLGAVNSTTRTADQTQIAQFWNDAGGTFCPPGHWNAIAQTVAQQTGNSLADDARLFAQLNVALADAGITAWNAKYTYATWRPITAIQTGGDGLNPRVTADPNWYPLLTTPNFPEYISGHSTFSGAAATVLTAVFGPSVSFTSTEPTLPGVVRSYTSFEQAAQEAGLSRIYAGIHFSFSNTDGLAAGRNVADYVLRTFDLRTDTVAPRVALDDVLPGGASNRNVTVTGQATDNLAGVTGLEVQVDGGAWAALGFDGATGRFSFATSFPLSGTADGRHTVSIRATDAAGNVGTAALFAFTLATQAPELVLTGPAEGDVLTARSNVAGRVTAGAPVVSLGYSFDGGAALTPVVIATDGTFSQGLNLAKLAAGAHTLTVQARDAAGNTATRTVNVSLAARIDLTVTSITPSDGAREVGVTFRPKVVFSRAVDPATLTPDALFATDPTGVAVPATVVPSGDGTFAWLFFSSPLPGATAITLTVDGSKIRAADGTPLDAAGTGTAGSVLTTTYVTVNQEAIAGTSLSGILADPGPDLKPMTRDDVRNGPDGVLGSADDVYLRPLQGVKVYILGHEDEAVFTDAQGYFHFDAVPTGDVKVALVGNAPGVLMYDPDAGQFIDPGSKGLYFPEMVMDLMVKAGRANTIMGTMGSREQQAAFEDALGVYLPRLATAILQPVSASQPTTIAVPAEGAPDLTPEQRQFLTLTVQPNSAVGPDGQVLTDVQIGVSTVPTALIRDMLPTGVQQPLVTITVQAPGVAVFTTPVMLTFPNVYNDPPGTKLTFVSFDHTTGRLEVEGTATVSADGQYVVSDPDSGLTHPGWHFVITGTQARTPVGGLAGKNNPDPGCASGDDFASGDFPSVSFGQELLIQAYMALTMHYTPVQWSADMLAALTVLGGRPGIDAWAHFMGGSGTEVTHGAGSILGDLAKNSNTVQGFIDNVKQQIQTNLQGQANSGPVVDNRSIDLTTPNISFGFNENEGLYTGFLKSVIGGTQGNSVAMEGFTATINSYSREAGGSATYSYRLHIEICDDFGVDGSDLTGTWYYSQPFNPLIPFWLLQHRTVGPRAFVNRIIIDTDTFTNTITIPPGYEDATVEIQAGLFANGLGLQETSPVSTVAGFGTDPVVYYRFEMASGLQVSGTFQPDHPPDALILPPSTFYTATFYQPLTNSSAQIAGFTEPSGATTVFAAAPMSGGPGGAALELNTVGGVDRDGDGIPDVGEYAVGTNPRKFSTTGDGIGDGAKLAAGLDPLDGRAFPTGVIAALPLPGPAEKLAVAGTRIYAAVGNGGLAVIDGSQFDNPVLLGQLALSGYATSVGVDERLQIAAVATRSSSGGSGGPGLALVDVADGTAPKLLRTVPVSAQQVVVAGGLAYAAAGGALSVVDLVTGEVIQSLSLPLSTVTGLARDGSFLYAYGGGTFVVIDIANEGEAARRGRLSVSIASSDVGVFAANGTAWLAGSGLRTVDVRNPDRPVLIHQPSGGEFVNARRLALNGSGLGVLAPDGGNYVELYDTRNPAVTPPRLLRIPVSASGTRDVVISRGIAYVGEYGRLEVVNYLPFDNQETPPSVTLSAAAADVDALTPGLQVLEGSSVPVQVAAADDVQVAQVELLVNGQVVQTDASYPFDFFAVAPSIAGAGSSFTVQVRATDTGGNVGLSNVLVVGLVSDTAPPTVTAITPASGASLVEGPQTVRVRFSKPLDAATVTAASFRLLDAGGGTVAAGTVQVRDSDRLVQLTFPFLAAGAYQLVIDAAAVADRVGHALGTGEITSLFTLTPRETLTVSTADADPGTPGVQVFEGATVRGQVTVAAGVSVQEVELLLDGRVVAHGTAAALDFAVVAPLLSSGGTSFTLQARVTDAGGFTTVSDLATVGLVRDTTPPAITGTTPADGGTTFRGVTAVQVKFSEPLAPATVLPGRFTLAGAGPDDAFGTGDDVAVVITAVTTIDDDTVVRLTVAPLTPGTYRLQVVKDGLTDRAGNALGTGVFTSTFTAQDRPSLTALLDLAGTPVAGDLVLVSDKLTLGVNPEGSLITRDNDTGLVFDGQEFITWGSPVETFSVAYNGQSYYSEAWYSDFPVTLQDLSIGNFHGVRIEGDVGAGLHLERVIGFFDGDQFATVAVRLTNRTSAPLANVAWMENTDPDQGIPVIDDFNTANDVVFDGRFVRASVVAPQYPGGLTMGFGSADPRAVADAQGFWNVDPYEILADPQDPDGAVDDIGIDLAFNLGTLPAHGVAVSGMLIVLGRSVDEADQVYQQAASLTLAGAQLREARGGASGASIAAGDGATTAVTVADIQPLAEAAAQVWAAALGLPALPGFTLTVADLPGGVLGTTTVTAGGAVITLDPTAGGTGWFVDPTPGDATEFPRMLGAAAFAADPAGPAAGRYDLYTVVLHEMGHALGFTTGEPDGDHLGAADHPWDLMNAALAPSVRELPSAVDVLVLHAAVLSATALTLPVTGSAPAAAAPGALGVVTPAAGLATEGPAALAAVPAGSAPVAALPPVPAEHVLSLAPALPAGGAAGPAVPGRRPEETAWLEEMTGGAVGGPGTAGDPSGIDAVFGDPVGWRPEEG